MVGQDRAVHGRSPLTLHCLLSLACVLRSSLSLPFSCPGRVVFGGPPVRDRSPRQSLLERRDDHQLDADRHPDTAERVPRTAQPQPDDDGILRELLRARHGSAARGAGPSDLPSAAEGIPRRRRLTQHTAPTQTSRTTALCTPHRTRCVVIESHESRHCSTPRIRSRTSRVHLQPHMPLCRATNTAASDRPSHVCIVPASRAHVWCRSARCVGPEQAPFADNSTSA